jgi:hypothetical protein
MTMLKHTTGPWDALATTEHGAILIGHKGTLVASIRPAHGKGYTTEQIANATLIAAAPDLLAALRTLLTEWDAPHSSGSSVLAAQYEAARAAIAKAGG